MVHSKLQGTRRAKLLPCWLINGSLLLLLALSENFGHVHADCGGGNKCVEGIYGYVQDYTDGFCAAYNQCGSFSYGDYPGCVCKPNSYSKSPADHYFTQSGDGVNYIVAYGPYELFADGFRFREGAQIYRYDLDTEDSSEVEAQIHFGLEPDAIVAWSDVTADVKLNGPSSVYIKFTFRVEVDGTYDIELIDQTCLKGVPAGLAQCEGRSAMQFKLERTGYQAQTVVPIEDRSGGIIPSSSHFDNYLVGDFRDTARGHVQLRTGETYRMELRFWPQGVKGDRPVIFSMRPRQ